MLHATKYSLCIFKIFPDLIKNYRKMLLSPQKYRQKPFSSIYLPQSWFVLVPAQVCECNQNIKLVMNPKSYYRYSLQKVHSQMNRTTQFILPPSPQVPPNSVNQACLPVLRCILESNLQNVALPPCRGRALNTQRIIVPIHRKRKQSY